MAGGTLQWVCVTLTLQTAGTCPGHGIHGGTGKFTAGLFPVLQSAWGHCSWGHWRASGGSWDSQEVTFSSGFSSWIQMDEPQTQGSSA